MRTAGRRAGGSPRESPPSAARRLLWFVAIWAMSVGALTVVGYGIKLWLGA